MPGLNRTRSRGTPAVHVLASAYSVAPALVIAVCAVASLFYAFGFFTSAVIGLDAVLPIDPADSSRGLALLSAISLGALAIGLLRNKAMAWTLAILTLMASLVAQSDALAHPIVIGASALAFVVLLMDRRRYEVESGFGVRRLFIFLAIVAVVVLGFQTLVIIIVTDDWPRPIAALGDLTWALSNSLGFSDETGQRVLRVASRDALLGLLVLVARLPVVLGAVGILARVPEPPPDPTTRSHARAIAGKYGGGALLPFQLGEDKFVFDPANEEGLVVYGLAGRTAVVLGDPIGPAAGAGRILREFVAHCRRLDRIPVFYQASAAGRDNLRAAGFRTFKVGEEAVIDLQSFDTTGSRRANLRHTITRCRRDGVEFRFFPDGVRPEDRALRLELEAVDASWRAKAGPPMGFSISQFDPEAIASLPVSVALDSAGRALAFTTYRRTGEDGWVLDLMRRREGSPPGVVEGSIAEAALGFKPLGFRSLSLGLAPLAGLDGVHGPFEERLLARGARLVQRWYDVRGLAFFKGKFDPDWVPRYGAIRYRRDQISFVVGLLWVHLAGAIHLPWRRRRMRQAAAI